MGSKIVIVTLALGLAVFGGMLWYANRPRPVTGPPPLTPEAKAYVRNLHLSDVGMKATESYVKQTVTEIEGKITNTGDRTVRQADVFCVFYDAYGQVVLRERVKIVITDLKPGETRTFRLPFDDIPEGWNNQMPQLVIARIEFT